MKRTKKGKKVKVVLIIMVLAVLIAVAAVLFYRDWEVRSQKIYSNKDFEIENYVSKVDKDGDGIDDQTDILEGVKAYVATEPEYKSAYYAGGYPNDGYGVCTDVVAQGFLNAGYDLMELVSADIAVAPEAYVIETPDKNIDFRRVRNLMAFFERYATELTTDINDIDEWQGGDIIIFKGENGTPSHIGIASDNRNYTGIVLMIHHGSVDQEAYEEDNLEENKDDIIGHFRWN